MSVVIVEAVVVVVVEAVYCLKSCSSGVEKMIEIARTKREERITSSFIYT